MRIRRAVASTNRLWIAFPSLDIQAVLLTILLYAAVSCNDNAHRPCHMQATLCHALVTLQHVSALGVQVMKDEWLYTERPRMT